MEVTSLKVFLKFTYCHAGPVSPLKIKNCITEGFNPDPELTLEWSSPSTSSEDGGSREGEVGGGGRVLTTPLDVVRKKAGVPKIKL